MFQKQLYLLKKFVKEINNNNCDYLINKTALKEHLLSFLCV